MDAKDPLQRFGYVKAEGTSFTVSEPFSPLEIEPLLYTYANAEQKKILREQFGVEPFSINTIRLIKNSMNLKYSAALPVRKRSAQHI